MTISRLTNSEDGTSWVDAVPGSATYGYVAQNTNITARSNGLDSTTIEIPSATTVRVKQGGVVDVDGVPFLIGADTDLTLAGPGAGSQFIKLVADTATTKTAVVTSEAPTWNASKNAYETATGDRVLNWALVIEEAGAGPVAVRLGTPSDPAANSNRSGLSLGCCRWFEQAGTYYLPVITPGIYEIDLVGTGGKAAGGTSGDGAGHCFARVRLGLGDMLTVYLATPGGPGEEEDSTVTASVADITMTAGSGLYNEGGGGAASVTGVDAQDVDTAVGLAGRTPGAVDVPVRIYEGYGLGGESGSDLGGRSAVVIRYVGQ